MDYGIGLIVTIVGGVFKMNFILVIKLLIIFVPIGFLIGYYVLPTIIKEIIDIFTKF